MILTEEELFDLKTNRIINDDFLYYKYAPATELQINLLKENKDKLDQEKFSLPLEKIYTDYGQYIGFTMQENNNYTEIHKYIKDGTIKSLDRNYIVKQLIELKEILLSVGLLYYDFHDKNIFINKDEQIRLIDLDGTIINPTKKDYVRSQVYFTEFLFSLFLDKQINQILYINHLNKLQDKNKYFSSYVLEYLSKCQPIQEECLNYDINTFIEEIQNKEKMKELSLHI